jgi:ATP-dependent DNA helicase RecQ
MFDGTIKAQQVLSCIYRLKLDTSVKMVIAVLRGSSNKRIVDNEYQQLSTYGIGKAHSESHWFSIIQQLVHLGLIRIDMTAAGILKLNEAARAVLKGEQVVQLAVPKLSVKSTKPSEQENLNIDKALFAKLKNLRKHIAQDDDVPAFVIFSDATLADMASKLPTSTYEMLNVSGVGEKKLERYGYAFINLIEDYLASKH